MQARTFLHNVRLGLLVIPVDAYLVLLGQIIQVLPTKVHAQTARHVLRARKLQLLVLQQQIVAHVLIVTRGSTEACGLGLPRHVLPAITKLVAVLKVAMQARTFLQNVCLGLLVIPVDAHLVLLGQIIQILTTKPNAHLSRHVVHR